MIKNITKSTAGLVLSVLACSGSLAQTSPIVLDTLLHLRATAFTEYTIGSNPRRPAFSNNGSRIVFSTYESNANAKQVYTVNSDGSDLKLIFDYATYRTGCPCQAPFIDISGDGSTIVWTDGTGEIFVSGFDGSGLHSIVDTLENVNSSFSDFDVDIRNNPRLTYDGSKVYFFSVAGGRSNAGLFSVGTSGAGLSMLFSYENMAMNVFGDDGLTFNPNTAFTSSPLLPDDESNVYFTTHNLTTDLNYGHILKSSTSGTAELFRSDGNQFGMANQLAVSADGKMLAWIRKVKDLNEYQPILYDLENEVEQPLDHRVAVTSSIQLDSLGQTALVSQYISEYTSYQHFTLLYPEAGGKFMPVILDGLAELGTGFQLAKGPVLSPVGEKIAFYSAESIPQLWVTQLHPDSIPVAFHDLSNPLWEPNYVLRDASTTATFLVNALSGAEPIDRVNFNAFIDSSYAPRVLRVDYDPEGNLLMYDDGSTYGDVTPGDGIYTNNTIKRDLPDYTATDLSIRFNAYSPGHVTSLDVWPFYLTDEVPTTRINPGKSSSEDWQAYPNPATNEIRMRINEPAIEFRQLKILDIHGRILRSRDIAEREASIDISMLDPGVYYLQGIGGETVSTKRFVKL